MRAECANCHHFAERHWNHNKTFEIGRCMADKRKRLTVASDPTVIRKTVCNDYKPLKANWRPPVTKEAPKMRNGVKEAPKKGKKVKK